MLPSKEEIRVKYGILESDFAVLQQQELPPLDDMMRDGYSMNKLGYWGRFEVWLKRTIIGGVLMAVAFIGGVTSGVEAIHKYGTIIYAHQPQITYYVGHFADYAKEQAKGLLVHTDSPPTKEDVERKEWPMFPTGTSIYPVSGSWRIG